MKLSYFQLLTKTPIYIPKVGGIICPKLQDIADIGGEEIYNYYLHILLLDTQKLFAARNQSDVYDAMSEPERQQINIYDTLTENEQDANVLQMALNFFFKEDVEYSPEHHAFAVKGKAMVKDGDKLVEKYVTIGVISKENYHEVVDVICQRNNIKTKDIADPNKVKNKKALAILNKLKKGREEMAKVNKADNNMELGNIISAVANRSQSLNITNIWELTVFQLWDSFARITNNNVYDINAASVSAWGDKDKKFDFNGWYKKLSD